MNTRSVPREVLLCETLTGPMLAYAADGVIGRLLAVQGHFGEHKIDEVADFLAARGHAPDLFVDIGANIGTHLVHALQGGRFREGLGVEADPSNYALLKANVGLRELASRTRLFHCALSDHPGTLELELCPSNFGDHRVRVAGVVPPMDLGESARETRHVTAETADALFVREQVDLRRALVWMDTQGHEGHILAGGAHTLALAPAMVLEFWPYGLERAGGREPYFHHLRGCDIYDIQRPDWVQSGRVSVEHLEAAYGQMVADTRLDNYPHTDLLCIRRGFR